MPASNVLRKLDWTLPRACSWGDVRSDLIAGLTVAAIALPESMAYAVIAGVDPRFGLYSSIVLTAVASFFGSSSHLITGPTSAISLVLFSALAFFDPDDTVEVVQALFLLGVMIGTIQVFIAVFRLGDLTRYISESVILGFMVGAAAVLAISQVANFLGVRAQGTGHQNILHRLWLTLTEGYPFNLKAIAISAGTVALVLVLRKLVRAYRLPHLEMLTVLVVVTAAVFLLGWSQPDAGGMTAIAVAGAVPASLPSPHIPEIKFAWVSDLGSSALAIALLGLLEALAAAKSIASQSGQSLDYNRVCLSQGLANLAGGFFRCMPGSGSLTRSAINFQAGAVTRMSGVITAVAVGVALLLIAPLIQFVPKAALAGLLVITAAGLINLKRVSYTTRASRYDAALVLVTALTAIFVGVEYSILLGVALSILLFVPRASKLKAAELVVSPERVVRERLPTDPPCTAVILFDLEGEFFFGAAPELDRYLNELKHWAEAESIRFIILRLKRIRNPDAVCLERIDHFLHEAKKLGITVLFAGVQPDLIAAMKSLKFQNWYPADNIFPQEGNDADTATLKAVRRAYELLGGANTCAHCAKSTAPENREVSMYYLV